MSHSGNPDEPEEQNDDRDNLFEEGGLAGQSPDEEFTRIQTQSLSNCVVLLRGGKLFMEDCLLALNFIIKNFKGILPAVVVGENTEAIINRCEIKGTSSKNQDAKTIGILVKLGDLLIKDSKVHNQTHGGILVQGQ